MTECDVRKEHSSDGDPEAGDADHLDELPDGSGCTEIWEHLSERRQRERNDSRQDPSERTTREDE